jgi:hypothetical protein
VESRNESEEAEAQIAAALIGVIAEGVAVAFFFVRRPQFRRLHDERADRWSRQRACIFEEDRRLAEGIGGDVDSLVFVVVAIVGGGGRLWRIIAAGEDGGGGGGGGSGSSSSSRWEPVGMALPTSLFFLFVVIVVVVVHRFGWCFVKRQSEEREPNDLAVNSSDSSDAARRAASVCLFALRRCVGKVGMRPDKVVVYSVYILSSVSGRFVAVKCS